MFTELSIRLSNDTLEQMDAAIEKFRHRLTDRQEFFERAIEYTLATMREESEMLMLALEDES